MRSGRKPPSLARENSFHCVNLVLAGEASAAKSQVCLQLLLACQLPPAHGGLGGSALYIYTEGDPALERLRELSRLLVYRQVCLRQHASSNEVQFAPLPLPPPPCCTSQGPHLR